MAMPNIAVPNRKRRQGIPLALTPPTDGRLIVYKGRQLILSLQVVSLTSSHLS